MEVLDLVNVDESQLSDELKLKREITISCIMRVQALARRFLQRSRVVKGIASRFEKIFDPNRKLYYYYDSLLDKSTWIKPKLLLASDIPIAPTYSPDEAAIRIQRQLWRFCALKRVRRIYKETITVVHDESTGDDYYYNPKSGATYWELPLFMGGKLVHDYVKKKKTKKNQNDGDISVGSHQSIDKNNEIDDDDDGDEEEGGGEEAEENVDDDDSEGSDSQDSDDDLDSVQLIEKRRSKRKYPRSKAQGIVDVGEDNISHCFSLNLSGIGASRFTSRIYDLEELQALNMSNNQMDHISRDIGYLSKLTTLDVSNNKIRKLPKELELLHNLVEFHAGKNELSTYSGYFYKLKRLEILDFSHNLFSSLPIEIGNLELLKDLHEWEVGIGQLVNLYKLDISYNRLTEWPKQLDSLTLLATLKINNNQVVSIPSNVKGNENLTNLDASYNLIGDVAEELFSSPLVELRLNNNIIENLPVVPWSNNMLGLVYVDISYNSIKCLHDIIATFPKVKSFYAQYNKIAEISNGISKMTSLVTLNLSHNELSDIPLEFANCTGLVTLNLSFNQLTSLPVSLSTMKSLRYVDASNNLIEEASGKIFSVATNIEELDLKNNRLSKLPVPFYGLRKLKLLNVSYNKLNQLYENMAPMTSLEELRLSFNAIPSIPDSISKLTNLRILELECNSISSVPPGISKLTNLTRVALKKNNLSVSPLELFLLPKLISWDLSWNQMIVSLNIDPRKEDETYFKRQQMENFISLPTLDRYLRKAWETMKSITDEVQNDISKNLHKTISFQNSMVRTSEDQELIKLQLMKMKHKKKMKDHAFAYRIEKQEAELLSKRQEKIFIIMKSFFDWHRQIYRFFTDESPLDCDRTLHNSSTQTIVDLLQDTSSSIRVDEDTIAASLRAKESLRMSIYRTSKMNRLLSLTRKRTFHDLDAFGAMPDTKYEDIFIDMPNMEWFRRVDLGYRYSDSIRTFEVICHEIHSLAFRDYFNSIRQEARSLLELRDSSGTGTGTDVSPHVQKRIDNFFSSVLSKYSIVEETLQNHIPICVIISHSLRRDSKLCPFALEAYLGLGTALSQRADILCHEIRSLEKEMSRSSTSNHISSMDIAQRSLEDFQDLAADRLEELEKLLQDMEKAATYQSIASKKKSKIEEFLNKTKAMNSSEENKEDFDGETKDAGVPSAEELEEIQIKKSAAAMLRGNGGEGSGNGSSGETRRSKTRRHKKDSAHAKMGSGSKDALPLTNEEGDLGGENDDEEDMIDEEMEVVIPDVKENVDSIGGNIRNVVYLLVKYRRLSLLQASLIIDHAVSLLSHLGLDPLNELNRVTGDDYRHLTPLAVRIYYCRGRIYQGREEYALAIVDFQCCLKLSKGKFRPASVEICKTLLAKGDYWSVLHWIVSLVPSHLKDISLPVLRLPETIGEIWKHDRTLAFLALIASAGMHELEKTAFNRLDQRKVFHVREDGVLEKYTIASMEEKLGNSRQYNMDEVAQTLRAERERDIKRMKEDEISTALLQDIDKVALEIEKLLVESKEQLSSFVDPLPPKKQDSSSRK